MAPRPLLMISTSGDWTKLTPQVEFPFIRGIYELYGAADKVANAHFDDGHNYHRGSREAMYPFMARWLLNKPELTKVSEGDIKKFDDAELAVWTDENVPRPLMNIDELTARLQKTIEAENEAAAPVNAQALAALQRRVTVGLNHILGAQWLPRDQVHSLLGMQPGPGAAARSARDLRNAWFTSRNENPLKQLNAQNLGRGHITRRLGPLAVIVTPALTASFEESARESRTAYVTLTPVAVTAQPAKRPQFFTTFNRSDAAEAAVDTLAVLTVRLQYGHDSATFRADGELGPIGLVARALVPTEAARNVNLRTVIDMNGFDITSDEAYLQQLNLPHIRRIGGLRAVAAVACNGPIWFHNVGEHFDEAWVKAAGDVNGVEVRVTREKAESRAIEEWLGAPK